MLHGLRGPKPAARVPLTSFSFPAPHKDWVSEEEHVVECRPSSRRLFFCQVCAGANHALDYAAGAQIPKRTSWTKECGASFGFRQVKGSAKLLHLAPIDRGRTAPGVSVSLDQLPKLFSKQCPPRGEIDHVQTSLSCRQGGFWVTQKAPAAIHNT